MIRILAAVAFLAFSTSSFAEAPFELKSGDRVAFVGNTFTERDLYTGYFETLLTLRYHDRDITFRNLGWSGDTVWGHARAGFGSPQDGFNSLGKIVGDVKPTHIFVAYGMSESFEGAGGIAVFTEQLGKMLDQLAASKASIILVSPIQHEALGAPLPDPTEHNKSIRLYSDVLKKAATDRGYRYIDLYEILGVGDANARFTDNGVHLTPYGYWRAALALEKGLGLAPLAGVDLSPLAKGSKNEKAEALRAAILEKNIHFFNRWRPHNDTYIYGFRKHEQGKNAAMIPQFEPLIAAKEAEIAKLRVEAAKASGIAK